MSTNADRFPDIVEVVVEIPRGSRNKYEWDEHAGVFPLDRVLSSAVFYNFDYGFVPDTRAGDGRASVCPLVHRVIPSRSTTGPDSWTWVRCAARSSWTRSL